MKRKRQAYKFSFSGGGFSNEESTFTVNFFTGVTNDKTIVRCDVAIQKLRGKSEAISGLEWGAFN